MIDRVEFVLTRACTGRCKHCSLGDPELQGEHLEYPRRQLITNGFFARGENEIADTAGKLNRCATEILLSVDAFHQETIPLGPVQLFAKHAKHVKLHPACPGARPTTRNRGTPLASAYPPTGTCARAARP